ncbi:MAG: phage holin family protein [Bacteroidia bacterium]|nr:phage holin family protein [Bacteroidia bacterium]
MPDWWVRYLKFWIIFIEAKAELAVGRWATRMLTILGVGIASLFAAILWSSALLFWLSQRWGWPAAGILVGSFWLLGAFLMAWWGPKWIQRRLLLKEVIYRLRLAQAAMQLMEKTYFPKERKQRISASIATLLIPLVWSWGRRWIMKKIKRWIPLLIS